jgi:hypothetical protein
MLLYFPSSRYSAFTEMMYMGNKSRTTVGKEDVANSSIRIRVLCFLIHGCSKLKISGSCSIFPLIVILTFTITTRMLISVRLGCDKCCHTTNHFGLNN